MLIIGITLRRENLRRELGGKGLKVYFAQELGTCKKKVELRQIYPKLELKLMCKSSLFLSEIVQEESKHTCQKTLKRKEYFIKF